MKWLLIAVAALLVIAISVGVTLFVTRSNDAGPSATSTSGAPSDIASANDTGPVAVITEEPTCGSWGLIGNELTAEQRKGWTDRDPSVPASAWTPSERAQYEAVGQAMRSAAARAVPLAKLTPHRVVRELYEQFIAYGRAYADSLTSYSPEDNHLASASNSASSTISWICSAITYGAASARGPLVAQAAAPRDVAPVGNPADPSKLFTAPNDVCRDWSALLEQFDVDSTAWRNSDPNISASRWAPEQRDIYESIAPVMEAFAGELQQLGRQSGNPVVVDFADLSAQYRRAYVEALPTYTPADNDLASAATGLAVTVLGACQAVGA